MSFDMVLYYVPVRQINMKKKKETKISSVKGRPMLHWVGKQPPEMAQYFPAQLREKFGGGGG